MTSASSKMDADLNTLFSEVSRRTVVEDIRTQLVSLIESGRFKVNDRLPSENELARSFNVSRPVIREALSRLQALGLTTSKNGKGTYVVSNRTISPLLLSRFPTSHLTEVRMYLEVPSARLAASRRTPEHVAQIGGILDALDREDDPVRRNEFDAKFHICVAEATRNPLFVRLIRDLTSILKEQAFAKSIVPGRRADASAEHRAVYNAIVERDADGAGKAMAFHLNAFDRARN
jgi:DNA-binding FadR family transcriptional regulator